MKEVRFTIVLLLLLSGCASALPMAVGEAVEGVAEGAVKEAASWLYTEPSRGVNIAQPERGQLRYGDVSLGVLQNPQEPGVEKHQPSREENSAILQRLLENNAPTTSSEEKVPLIPPGAHDSTAAGESSSNSNAILESLEPYKPGSHPLLPKRIINAILGRRLYHDKKPGENPYLWTIGLPLVLLGSAAAVLGFSYHSLRKDCKKVKENQEKMQREWDEDHPRGFIPAGTDERPMDAKCHPTVKDTYAPKNQGNGADLY